MKTCEIIIIIKSEDEIWKEIHLKHGTEDLNRHVIPPGGEKNLMEFQPISQSNAMACQSHGIWEKKINFW